MFPIKVAKHYSIMDKKHISYPVYMVLKFADGDSYDGYNIYDTDIAALTKQELITKYKMKKVKH